MPATFIITTPDAHLAAEWERQLPAPPLALARGDLLGRELLRPGARVWIRDVCDPEPPPPAHPDTVIIAVGEPRSVPFEEARQARSNTYCLSYEESRTHLRRLTVLAAELAQSRAILSVVQARPRRGDAAPSDAEEKARRAPDEFEFLAAAIGHLGDRPRVIEEFRRGARSRIRSSKVTVFLQEGPRFVADEGGWECAAGHDLVLWLQEHAAIVDAGTLESVEDPGVEASIRQKLGEWNSRLLVPLESDGPLEGWVAFGPRADGRPYGARDRDDSLMLVRVLSRLLGQHRMLHSALEARVQSELVERHGPKYRLLRPSDGYDGSLPVEVREVAALAMQGGARVEREFGRMRVTAGPVPEVGGCWVCWDEALVTQAELERRGENERHRILHDLGIMISHELANAMFSVSTYFQHVRLQKSAEDPGHPLLERVSQDLERMKAMPHLLSTLFEMTKQPTAPLDLRAVVQAAAKEVGGTALVPEAALEIWGHERNLRDALVWLCREVVERKERPEAAGRDVKFVFSLQQRGRDADAICLVTISYPGLRLEQLKAGEPTGTEEFPTVPVYLAREVIRFHHGSVHVGQGSEGPELMISLRSRRVGGLAEVKSEARPHPEVGSTTPFRPGAAPAAGDSEPLPASA